MAMPRNPHVAEPLRSIVNAASPGVPAATTRNLIETTAMFDDRDLAITTLCQHLMITDRRTADHVLSAQQYWKRMPVEARLQEIGNWLRAECFERINMVSADTPLAVVRTND